MRKALAVGITNFIMMFVLCLVFTSCRTANTIVSVGNVRSVRNELKQDIDTSVLLKGIPILAWFGVQEHTVERYRELKECGIDYNLTLFMSVEQFPQALDAAKEAGVKMIIYCEGLDNELESTVSRFKDHPALAGYFLYDEPSRDRFQHLGEMARRIQAIDNKHFCYVNLMAYDAYDYLGTSTYLEYVQEFIKEVPVPFLSFDRYPINADDSGVRFLVTIWYQNLKIISDEARKAGKPFWAFALTTPYLTLPISSLADLRLQVYTNLAYGAQGIQYFTYWTPNPVLGDFHDGPIDFSTGQRTPTWYVVKQMNEEIKALSVVFLGAQVIKVEHIVITDEGEDGTLQDGTTRFNFEKRPPEAKIIKKFNSANGTNAAVSFLENGKRCYMVVINNNLEGGDNATFTITGGVGLQLINKDGKAVRVTSKNSSQTITPGDALIYGWDIK